MISLTYDEAVARLKDLKMVRVINHYWRDEYYVYDNPDSISDLANAYKIGSVGFSFNPEAEEKAHEIMRELSTSDYEVMEYLHHFLVLDARCEY